jgi:outer membrane protein OmpA-like peptidoglycan-associated protein
MKIPMFITALCLATLAGCASKSTPVPATAPAAPPGTAPKAAAPGAPAASGPAAAAPVPPRASLAAEQKRLSELFQGTPVVFTMQADGSLKVEVPLSFCFDRGAFVVKPPLAAVLDRLARSQRGDMTKLRVSAAGDTAASGANLARDRAASARDYMVARGVLAARVVLANGAPGEGVEIVVSEAAAARR